MYKYHGHITIYNIFIIITENVFNSISDYFAMHMEYAFHFKRMLNKQLRVLEIVLYLPLCKLLPGK